MYVSLNGSKAAGKTTLAHSLSEAGYGSYAQFYVGRFEYQENYLSEFDPNADLSDWKRCSTLLCFALDWHRRIKHNNGYIIFDHSYADYLVQQLSSLRKIDALLAFIQEYDLPSFTDGHHLFIDTTYETYLERRTKREKEQPHRRGHEIIPQSNFEKRRDLYLALVDMGYLIHIDANTDQDTVFHSIAAGLKGDTHAQ